LAGAGKKNAGGCLLHLTGEKELHMYDLSAGRNSSSSFPLLSVYDGRICRGFVVARGKLGFEAFDCDKRGLGTYPTQREAANAIMERGR
jgi:hypothetical protein